MKLRGSRNILQYGLKVGLLISLVRLSLMARGRVDAFSIICPKPHFSTAWEDLKISDLNGIRTLAPAIPVLLVTHTHRTPNPITCSSRFFRQRHLSPLLLPFSLHRNQPMQVVPAAMQGYPGEMLWFAQWWDLKMASAVLFTHYFGELRYYIF